VCQYTFLQATVPSCHYKWNSLHLHPVKSPAWLASQAPNTSGTCKQDVYTKSRPKNIVADYRDSFSLSNGLLTQQMQVTADSSRSDSTKAYENMSVRHRVTHQNLQLWNTALFSYQENPTTKTFQIRSLLSWSAYCSIPALLHFPKAICSRKTSFVYVRATGLRGDLAANTITALML
jgi:hypothetical protein